MSRDGAQINDTTRQGCDDKRKNTDNQGQLSGFSVLDSNLTVRQNPHDSMLSKTPFGQRRVRSEPIFAAGQLCSAKPWPRVAHLVGLLLADLACFSLCRRLSHFPPAQGMGEPADSWSRYLVVQLDLALCSRLRFFYIYHPLCPREKLPIFPRR